MELVRIKSGNGGLNVLLLLLLLLVMMMMMMMMMMMHGRNKVCLKTVVLMRGD